MSLLLSFNRFLICCRCFSCLLWTGKCFLGTDKHIFQVYKKRHYRLWSGICLLDVVGSFYEETYLEASFHSSGKEADFNDVSFLQQWLQDMYMICIVFFLSYLIIHNLTRRCMRRSTFWLNFQRYDWEALLKMNPSLNFLMLLLQFI